MTTLATILRLIDTVDTATVSIGAASTLAQSTSLISRLDLSPGFIIARYILATATILCNGFLLILFIRFARLRKSECTVLIGIFAVFDFILGIGLFIRVTYATYASIHGITVFKRRTCAFVNTPQAVSLAATHVIVVAIALDRLEAIYRPLTYNRHVEAKKLTALMAIIVICVTLYIFYVFYDIDDRTTIPVCSMGPAAGSHHKLFANIFSNTTLLLLITIYVILLTLFVRRLQASARKKSVKSDQRRVIRVQRQVTVSVLFIIGLYVIFYMITPILLYISSFFHNADILAACVTLSVSMAMSVNATGSVLICLVKHEEIRKSALRALGFRHTITVQHSTATVTQFGGNRSKTKNEPFETTRRHHFTQFTRRKHTDVNVSALPHFTSSTKNTGSIVNSLS